MQIGMKMAALALGQREVLNGSAEEDHIRRLAEKNLELETTSTSMESFESEFESEKEIYNRNESKIILVTSSAKDHPMVIKQTPKIVKKNSQSFHQMHQLEFSRLIQNSPLKHLVSIHHVNETEDGVQVGMEYACGGNLTQHVLSTVNFITKSQKLNHLKVVKRILWEVVSGLEEIHQLGYVHRDIKPDNILISHAGAIKICDFQLVGPIGILDDSYCGTPEYMPPERLTEKRNNCTLDPSIDMWALGILAYQLLMGHVPFPFDEDIQQLIDSMYDGGYIRFDDDYPSYCRHFIFNLLQTNPRKRMTIQKVKKHLFFTTDFESPSSQSKNCLCNNRD